MSGLDYRRAIRDLAAKNAPGKHDQAEHGSWSQGMKVETPAVQAMRNALAKIKPTPQEAADMTATAASLKAKLEKNAAAMGLDCRIVQAGSSARGTWLTGDGDIDMFMLFPKSADQDRSLQEAMRLAYSACPDGEETFASHPYLSATMGKYEIDLVPSFAVDPKEGIMSAMDRTPYHNEYIQGQIDARNAERAAGNMNGGITDDVTDDIRLMKQFMKSNNVYGSDVKTGGFSGYSAENLVLHYGSFQNAVAAVADWKDNEYLAPNNNGGAKFDAPLTLIDPVDPNRNVCAVVSERKMDEFRDCCRQFMADPTDDYFTRKPYESPLGKSGLPVYSVAYDQPPGVNEDNLYPQLQHAARVQAQALEDADFQVHDHDVTIADGKCILSYEMMVDQLPAVRRQMGAPISMRDASQKFRDAHAGENVYVYNRRLAVDVPRKYTDVAKLLEDKAGALAPKYCKGSNVDVTVTGGQ